MPRLLLALLVVGLTLAGMPLGAAAAPMISGVSATGITDDSVSISWSTDVPTTGRIDYGTTTAYGQSLSTSMLSETTHSLQIFGLEPTTTYHYRITVTDVIPESSSSPDATFTTLAVPPPAASGFLSAQRWVQATNFFGPVELDASNGEKLPGDGTTLTIEGTAFPNGFGVHAPSEIRYSLTPGAGCTFSASVGIDDEVARHGPDFGAVVFQIFGDDPTTPRYQSPLVTGSTAALSVVVPMGGQSILRLVVSQGEDPFYDHADWANARLDCETTPPVVTATTPPNGATGVATTAAVTVTFSEALDPATVNPGTIILAPAVAAVVTYNGQTATLTPSGALSAGVTYTATVKGGSSGVKDTVGNPLATDLTWTFTTAPGPSPSASPTPIALAVTTDGAGTVSRTGNSLTPLPAPGNIFVGWAVDGQPAGWAEPLTIEVGPSHTVVATFAPRQTFPDAAPAVTGATEAIAQLAARGIIRGYEDGTFGPTDPTLRAQMAALIVRAMGWGAETPANPFPDRNGVDDELWQAVAILADRGVARGYGDGTYGTTDPVLNAQVISFITRAMVDAGYWQAVTLDDPTVYPNIPASSGHRLDLLTYLQNAGPVRGGQTVTADFAGWDAVSSRAYFAFTLWQALDSYFSVDRVP